MIIDQNRKPNAEKLLLNLVAKNYEQIKDYVTPHSVLVAIKNIITWANGSEDLELSSSVIYDHLNISNALGYAYQASLDIIEGVKVDTVAVRYPKTETKLLTIVKEMIQTKTIDQKLRIALQERIDWIELKQGKGNVILSMQYSCNTEVLFDVYEQLYLLPA